MISQEIKIARSSNVKYRGKDIDLDFGSWDKQWRTEEEYLDWCKRWLKECVRVLKPYRHLVFFFDKKKITPVWEYLENLGMKGRSPLYWIKCLNGSMKLLCKINNETTFLPIREIYRLKNEHASEVRLLSPKGEWIKVVEIQKQYSQGIALYLQDGSILKVTPEHKFKINGEFISANKLKVGDILDKVEKIDITEGRNKAFFNFDLGWAIGLFLAEGSLGKDGTEVRFSLNKKEVRFYYKLKSIVDGFNSPIRKHIYRNGLIVIIDCFIFSGIIRKFIQGKGAKKKFLNIRELLKTNNEFLEGILKGFFDGDGMKEETRVTMRFGLSDNKQLAETLLVLSSILGYDFRLKKRFVNYQNGRKKAMWISIGKSQHKGFKTYPTQIKRILSIKEANAYYNFSLEKEHQFILPNRIISHNSNPVPRGRKVDFMKAVEMALWFTKTAVKQDYFNWRLGQARDYVVDSIPQHPRYHPTQKAEKPLIQWINYLSKPGDIVMDPFIGSGTTAVVARQLGRNFIGFEINSEYVKLAEKRLAQQVFSY